SDVEHVAGEGLAVTIRASKTDQAAHGVTRRIHYASAEALCPVRAVLAWLAYLAAHGHTAGPLFTRVDRWGNLGADAGGRYRAAPPRSGRARDGRLRPQAIGDIVTAACVAAGLAAPVQSADRADVRPVRPGPTAAGERRYSGHSLRRGGAT